ncbi:hypothetical protein [Thauera sinica]|uniref:Uncharacterized protein n=1 Tax=Thauera sinica TaxID=2665146 RepID=A0ABW1AP39_9RHOO|nr:hypothetical protein [Thauera sp. K11]
MKPRSTLMAAPGRAFAVSAQADVDVGVIVSATSRAAPRWGNRWI